MFGVEPYSGHSFEAQWLEWDDNNKVYKPPVSILIKGDAGIGISSGIREDVRVQDINGRWVVKKTFIINTVQNHNYKMRDKIKTIFDEETYVILKTSPDITHDNSMQSLMFPKAQNLPKKLYLGKE